MIIINLKAQMKNKTTQYYVDNDFIDKRIDLFLKSKMNLKKYKQ